MTVDLKTWEQANLKQFQHASEQVQSFFDQQTKPFDGDMEIIGSRFWSDRCLLSKDNQDDYGLCAELFFPKISILRQMNVQKIMEGIRFFTRCFKELRFYSHFHGMWLYALLACLEKPLQNELCNSLRELSCVCSLLRAKLDPESDSDKFQSLHLIICIIGKHFAQHDMTDDFEL